MAEVDRYIEHAEREGIKLDALMMSPAALDDFANNGRDCSSRTYRGVPIEEHDEWSWGWMIRTKGGGYLRVPRVDA